jgi:hypothetical protein
MAERRMSDTSRIVAVRDVALEFGEFSAASSWFVRDAADDVAQPFYAALDGESRLCWTDDRDRAQRFGSKQAAERFAADRVTTEVCIVPLP